MIDDPDDPFPLVTDRYEIRAGLRPLRGKLFHVGKSFDCYRSNKVFARTERLGKYYQSLRFDLPARNRIQRALIDRVLTEHPDLFHLERHPSGSELICRHTAERLRFNSDGNFISADTSIQPSYIDGFDALAMQVEEDLIVMQRDGSDNWASAIHLCAPNHWSAEQNIGRPFTAMHEPVPEIDSINRRSQQFVDMMIRATSGLERIAWGISTDAALNRHPQRDPDLPPPRVFDPSHPQAYLRIERQAMLGFPEIDALLFAIHTTFQDCNTIRRNRGQRERLIRAMNSMSVEILQYKGLIDYRDELIRWLDSPIDE